MQFEVYGEPENLLILPAKALRQFVSVFASLLVL